MKMDPEDAGNLNIRCRGPRATFVDHQFNGQERIRFEEEIQMSSSLSRWATDHKFQVVSPSFFRIYFYGLKLTICLERKHLL